MSHHTHAHTEAHNVQYVGICMWIWTHTHTQGQSVVNGVFEWNRMTVGIHAGFPLLNSAIRLTVYGSVDVPAHLQWSTACACVQVCVCGRVHAKLSTCSQWSMAPGDFYTPYTNICMHLCVFKSMFASERVHKGVQLHAPRLRLAKGLGFGTQREGIPTESDRDRAGSHWWLQTAASRGKGVVGGVIIYSASGLQLKGTQWSGGNGAGPVYLSVIDGVWAQCRVQSQERRCCPGFSSGSCTAPLSVAACACSARNRPSIWNAA